MDQRKTDHFGKKCWNILATVCQYTVCAAKRFFTSPIWGMIARGIGHLIRVIIQSPIWPWIGRKMGSLPKWKIWGWLGDAMMKLFAALRYAGRSPSDRPFASDSSYVVPHALKGPWKKINRSDPAINMWPDFYEARDENYYMVRGFCEGFSRYWRVFFYLVGAPMIYFIFIGGIPALILRESPDMPEGVRNFWQALNTLSSMIMMFIAAAAGFYAYRTNGKEISVVFLGDKIGTRRGNKGGFDTYKLDKVDQASFRMVYHEDLILQKRMRADEAEKLQDYREIFFEYGARSIKLCEINSLHNAELFIRMLQEGFKRSQRPRRIKEEAPTEVSSDWKDYFEVGEAEDPDDLPE